MTKIAIALTAALDFRPPNAITGESVARGSGFNVRIDFCPAVIDGPNGPYTVQGSGDWLEQDSFGQWQRRPNPDGSDAQFVASSNGYIVAADRAGSPAFLTPMQTWSE